MARHISAEKNKIDSAFFIRIVDISCYNEASQINLSNLPCMAYCHRTFLPPVVRPSPTAIGVDTGELCWLMDEWMKFPNRQSGPTFTVYDTYRSNPWRSVVTVARNASSCRWRKKTSVAWYSGWESNNTDMIWTGVRVGPSDLNQFEAMCFTWGTFNSRESSAPRFGVRARTPERWWITGGGRKSPKLLE